MIWIYLILGFFLLPGLALLFARAFGVSALFFLRPKPARAPRPSVPDCSVPADAVTLTHVGSGTTGGVYHARNIAIPFGTVIALTSTLILVADDSLVVDGTITFAPAPVPPNMPVNIILVCRNANVVINGTVGVPFGFAPLAAPAGAATNAAGLYASASGGAGESAGYIKIVAPSAAIDIEGWVQALAGGLGGSATANGVAVWRNLTGGTAGAAGGQGGAGGYVCLCAYDAINFGSGSGVFGGIGGGGGVAQANAVNGSPAYAEGGPSNHGGNVLLHGLAPGATCQVFNDGRVQGGAVQFGNYAKAAGGNALALGGGGDASAWGGWAGAGGSVEFDNCLVVVGNVGIFNSWKGGGGGPADANGGNGIAILGATIGGDALARGGDGGANGPIPQIPLTDGSTQAGGLMTGTPPGLLGLAYGKGGDANALAGSGGGAGRIWAAGASGTEDALGGMGSGATPATPATAAAVPGRAGAGGVAVVATSVGTP